MPGTYGVLVIVVCGDDGVVDDEGRKMIWILDVDAPTF